MNYIFLPLNNFVSWIIVPIFLYLIKKWKIFSWVCLSSYSNQLNPRFNKQNEITFYFNPDNYFINNYIGNLYTYYYYYLCNFLLK